MYTTITEPKTTLTTSSFTEHQMRYNTPVRMASVYGQDSSTPAGLAKRHSASRFSSGLPLSVSKLITLLNTFNALREPNGTGNQTNAFKKAYLLNQSEEAYHELREHISQMLINNDDDVDSWLMEHNYPVVLKPSPRIYLGKGAYVIFR